jgi:hypothetical protein
MARPAVSSDGIMLYANAAIATSPTAQNASSAAPSDAHHSPPSDFPAMDSSAIERTGIRDAGVTSHKKHYVN